MKTWEDIINLEKKKDYYKALKLEIEKRYENSVVFPKKENIFKAFTLTKFDNLKVVILGQDPYHGVGQAQGLSFSTPENIKNPPSMQNILKEIENDLGRKSYCEDGDLSSWAKQGVLLLNATLTVEASNPGSHQKKGWEKFTDAVIQQLSDKKDNVVFILWGAYAQKKGAKIDRFKHFVIESAHPSPLGAYRGFWGSKPFSKTNSFLEAKNIQPIDWKIK